ncbi:MAG: type III pantothenate kinase [Cyanobacteriota bacterium]
MSGRRARVLLIGNSRWHWAEPSATGEVGAFPVASEAGAGGAWCGCDGPPPPPGAWAAEDLMAWAAVGPVPERYRDLLPPSRRIATPQVPLRGAPAWLGVDRALVAWQAWRRQQALAPAPVLVADAGTVLSLTLVGREGGFLGGRLLAGAALQWRAMAAGTVRLPELAPELTMNGMACGATDAEGGAALTDLWPQATTAAMEVGVLQGLAAAVAAAHGQLRQGDRTSEAAQESVAAGGWRGMAGLRLWLCGGDGPRLAPLLRAAGVPAVEAPHLAMEALIQLAGVSSGPDR